ncbi:MAG: NAD-dependent epimerase/dehydratase family protein [Trueperaceae bacterium]
MKVLVTGGAGFIGSHLVDALLSKNYDVVVLDNLSTGKVENLPKSPRLRLHVGDLTDPSAVDSALVGCAAFVHLAAIASVEQSVIDPLRTHRTNLHGSIQLFEAAQISGVRRAIYASSAAVYGDTEDLPISETAKLRPLTPYAIDKAAGEQYLAFYHRTGALDATAFRFFNVFGPRQNPNSQYSGVISIFLDRALKGDPITVFGDGQQTRDFVYVGDVVAALIAALEFGGRADEMPIYNVARGESLSLVNLLELVGSLPGALTPLHINHAPPRKGDVRHSLANASKLIRELAWHPEITPREGLLAILSERHQF